MNCGFCAGVRQFALNFLLWLDKTLNFLLLGDPNETVSRRSDRARKAGVRFAIVFCKVLAFLLGHDHCEAASVPGTIGTEIWHWSDNFTQPELTAQPSKPE